LGDTPAFSGEAAAPWAVSLINRRGSDREFPGHHLKGFGWAA
jgi:hypothetical protein